jgi:hypothetical protein
VRTRRCDPCGGAGEHGCTEVHARDGRCEPFDLCDIRRGGRLLGVIGFGRLLASRTCARTDHAWQHMIVCASLLRRCLHRTTCSRQHAADNMQQTTCSRRCEADNMPTAMPCEAPHSTTATCERRRSGRALKATIRPGFKDPPALPAARTPRPHLPLLLFDRLLLLLLLGSLGHRSKASSHEHARARV